MWFTIVDGLMRAIAALFAFTALCCFALLVWQVPTAPAFAIAMLLALPFAYLLVAMVRPRWTAPIGQAIRDTASKFREAVIRPYVARPLDKAADYVDDGALYVGRGMGWIGLRLWKVAAPALMVVAGLIIMGLLIFAGIAIFQGMAALPISVAVIIGAIIIAGAVSK